MATPVTYDCTGDELGTHLCNCEGIIEQQGALWVQTQGETGCKCTVNAATSQFEGCYCDRSLGFYKIPQSKGCPCHTARLKKCNDGAKRDAQHVCINPAKPGVDDYNCTAWDYTLTWLLGGTIIIAAIATPLLIKWYKYLDAQVAKMEQENTEKAESQL